MGIKAINNSHNDRPDGIERVTNAVVTGIVGIVMVCAMLPVLISQIDGLGDNSILAGWDGLASFQALAYIIPTIFIIGLVVVTIRFFSSSRE